ncbi:Gfo/Idh/MocA family protein [Pseudonocardia spinosispora]|uniref:Gfo/Idh/MocA family protein n=1 Tax=Pseudonocardia spinosispora TaxID=103441 RepID=UPI000414F12E|nr:Gfo/Idh/MocA family oxidoreductase [Pseudonocardia spinosispora]
MIGVGIVGASPERGWALRAHVPALRSLPGYRLAAVATSRPESASLAASRFGAAHAFTDPRRLAEHPAVDLVVVTVQVAAHAELVGAALAAGKHVYCEWPLGRDTAEAAEMTETARSAGVLGVVGLQSRFAPAMRRAVELVAAGELGRITSVTVHAKRSKGAEDTVPGWTEYTYRGDGGAGLLEVYGGHVLDAVETLAGPVAELSAGLSIQRPRHTVAETGQVIEVTAPDHLLLHGRFAGGAVLSAHVHDGAVGPPGAHIVLTGTAGELTIQTAPSEGALGGQLQIDPLTLHHSSHEVSPRVGPEVPDQARNVAALYAVLAGHLAGSEPAPPTFADGLRVHRLLDAVRTSAALGGTVAA